MSLLLHSSLSLLNPAQERCTSTAIGLPCNCTGGHDARSVTLKRKRVDVHEGPGKICTCPTASALCSSRQITPVCILRLWSSSVIIDVIATLVSAASSPESDWLSSHVSTCEDNQSDSDNEAADTSVGVFRRLSRTAVIFLQAKTSFVPLVSQRNFSRSDFIS